jgi:dTDP-4-dehydrorhamnose 3,5-epimerase
MEMMRWDWEVFDKFGQACVSTCYQGVIKAWHYHKLQDDRFTCVQGVAKLALYDAREDSPTKSMMNEFYIGNLNPILVKTPFLVYHGFTVVGNEMAMIVNFPTELYNYTEPDEYCLPYDDPSTPYEWEVKMG